MTESPSPAPPFDLTAAELRVVGCLIEKESTVPDSYPLTINSLRTACNQSTSRDPVVEYDDHTVEQALASLRELGLIRIVYSTSNRATKYRHVLPDALDLEAGATAVLAVLMLRGPQTIGELKQRTDRMHHFDSIDDVAEELATLAARGFAASLPRRPGQKDVRWVQLLGAEAPADSADNEPMPAPAADDLVPDPIVVDGVTVRDLDRTDRARVVELWSAADLVRPWNDPNADIDRSLGTGGSILVAELDDRVVGAVMIGDDGHRGWLNYLATDPAHRRRGIGRALVTVAERRLATQGCPKVNVQIRSEHGVAMDFYEALGFDLDDVIAMGKRLGMP